MRSGTNSPIVPHSCHLVLSLQVWCTVIKAYCCCSASSWPMRPSPSPRRRSMTTALWAWPSIMSLWVQWIVYSMSVCVCVTKTYAFENIFPLYFTPLFTDLKICVEETWAHDQHLFSLSTLTCFSMMKLIKMMIVHIYKELIQDNISDWHKIHSF